MAKVYLDEIDAFLASGTISTLTTDVSDGTSVNDALLNFVDLSGTQLEGVNWDKFRGKFGEFNTALQARINLAKKLEEAINEALTLLKEYLGDDQMLDSSKLEEYKKSRQTCQNSIDNLNAMLTETREVQVEEGGQTYITRTTLYDSNEIRSQISLATDTLTELDRMIAKIEGLDEVYSRAEAILQSAFAGIDTFRSQVESIVPDATYSYKQA